MCSILSDISLTPLFLSQMLVGLLLDSIVRRRFEGYRASLSTVPRLHWRPKTLVSDDRSERSILRSIVQEGRPRISTLISLVCYHIAWSYRVLHLWYASAVYRPFVYVLRGLM